MKTFCVNHVPFGVTERLAALIDAKGLSSAAKKFQCGCLTGSYYLFEERLVSRWPSDNPSCGREKTT